MTSRTLQQWVLFFGGTAVVFGGLAVVQTIEYGELVDRYNADVARMQQLSKEVDAKRAEVRMLRSTISKMETVEDEPNTLAIRNRNPLNIKTVKGGWRGQIGVDKHGHAVFESPEYGIRAAANVLMNYATDHKIDTLQGIVNRFCTGNREAYAAFLAKRLGLKSDQPFDVLERLPELLRAMARFESGKEWPEEKFLGFDLLARL